jgi:outer membrane lipoprotein-sorting protein
MCLYALTSSANTPGRLSTPVTELADVLELMRRPGARFRTLQATGRDWQHRSRIDHAYGRGRPIGLAAISLVRTPGEGEPEESENIWRTWVELPDHRREEFAVGNETVSVVFVGSTWWSWSASRGGQTNGGRANSRHGVGPAERLLRPAAVLSSVELDVLGRTEVLSRQAYRVRAVPVTAHDFLLDRSDTGADEHELLVDAERGFLLRAEARLNGEPFRVLEMTDLAVDVDIPAATFMPAAPDGEGFVELPPRTVLLAELPKMPFKVFLPDPAPGKPGHVVLHYADRPRGAPLSATITYLVAEPGGVATGTCGSTNRPSRNGLHRRARAGRFGARSATCWCRRTTAWATSGAKSASCAKGPTSSWKARRCRSINSSPLPGPWCPCPIRAGPESR